MATEQKKQLVLTRVPPGDQWKDSNDPASGIFPSLTDGLEYTFQKSGGKLTEFHLSAFKGEIYSVTEEQVPDAPPPPKPRYSMYGEEVDEQPSLWNED